MDTDEICADCQKVITRRARANIFNDTILCTICYNRRVTEKARIEREQAWEKEREAWEKEREREREEQRAAEKEAVQNEPPTDRQIAFALELGIAIPADATKWSLSALITTALEEKKLYEETSIEGRLERHAGGKQVNCDNCGKGISPRAIANLWTSPQAIVCTNCFRTLKKADAAKNAGCFTVIAMGVVATGAAIICWI